MVKMPVSQTIRVLMIKEQLAKGKVLNTKATAKEFDVSDRTILRDINELRAFYAEQRVKGNLYQDIIYDKNKQGYVLD